MSVVRWGSYASGYAVGPDLDVPAPRPPKRPGRPKRCRASAKVRFATERTAEFHAVLAGIPMRWYRCPSCAGWHLTRKNAKPLVRQEAA